MGHARQLPLPKLTEEEFEAVAEWLAKPASVRYRICPFGNIPNHIPLFTGALLRPQCNICYAVFPNTPVRYSSSLDVRTCCPCYNGGRERKKYVYKTVKRLIKERLDEKGNE